MNAYRSGGGVSEGLVRLLGGTAIVPGRENEALEIGVLLRERAKQGDPGASEDLAVLTRIIVADPRTPPALADRLLEEALEASCLQRHRQQHAGALARRAVAMRDLGRAQRYAALLATDASDLESASEVRVTHALLAAAHGDAGAITNLLGPTRDAVPIAPSLAPLASVLRAHACELRGDVRGAEALLLTELDSNIALRDAVRDAGIPLCARSAAAAEAALVDRLSAARFAHEMSASGADALPIVFGVMMTLVGGLLSAFGVGFVGVPMLVVATLIVVVWLVWRRGHKRKRVARLQWLLMSGRIAPGQIRQARRISLTQLRLSITVPNGPAFDWVIDSPVPESELIGKQVPVVVSPQGDEAFALPLR